LNSNSKRLYYTDAYQKTFRATVTSVSAEGRRVILDQTAFYPASGGQPHDLGSVNGIAIEDVIDDGEQIIHLLAEPLSSSAVDGVIDWPRRFDHMQQHTGQHLLSAVIADLFGFETIGVHLGAESSTIDLKCASIGPEQLRSAELQANAVLQQNRPVSIAFEDAAQAKDLRKASDRTGLLRIVSISGLDRSACGGTHVHATGEIGAILLRSVEKIRGNVRLEFVCGNRAINRARNDYDSLEACARVFSSPVNDVPALVVAQTERLKATDKLRKRFETELAEHRGRDLHAQTPADAAGRRIHTRIIQGNGITDDLRTEAASFAGEGNCVFIAVAESPAAVLVASSPDSGVHSGNILKRALADFGGKGGGSANLAQGSFSGDPEEFLRRLMSELSAV
jgi:alanyl-tRNA synthetase